MTRPLLSLTLLAAMAACASTEGRTPVQTAQSLFGVMLQHNADAGKLLFMPNATMTTVHDDGKATSIPAEQWLERIGKSKDTLLERMWGTQVLEHGSIAVVWGSYDFHLNNKFHHCGVDSFNLIKTESGWRIANVSYTSETTGCEPSPLGPPAAQ